MVKYIGLHLCPGIRSCRKQGCEPESTMSRELRDKADLMVKELSEMLKPLREEIQNLRTADSKGSTDSPIK